MKQSLFSIAPGLPFLRTLSQSVLDGRILPGTDFRADPLALAALTIYVPTRRAARALGQEFARALGGQAAILPTILTVGGILGEGPFTRTEPAPRTLLPVVDPLERQMLVARFVRRWKAQLTAAERAVLDGEEAVVPASSADAIWLSRDLCDLLDEAEAEGTSLGALAGLAPERLASWWQLTLTFLAIVTEHWPAVLAERGVADEARVHNLALAAEAERLARHPGPVIFAGSTATAPAVIELMRAIARSDQGAIVLPGLDRFLDARGFDAIRTGDGTTLAGSAPGHPQYALKRILQGFLGSRDAVDHFAPPEDDPLSAREAFVSDALRPASTTDAWGAAKAHPPEALDGLALVETEDEREEALAIAVAMRDALSDPDATVALTTPDRSLARRVVAELERFGIAANDSAGRPLGATPPGTLMALVLDAALRPGDPIALVALLKHPLTRLGFPPADARRAGRAIEIMALRGQVGIADAANLSALFEAARAEVARVRAKLDAPQERGRRLPRAVTLLEQEDIDLAAEVAARLEAALTPLLSLRGSDDAEIASFAIRLTTALEAIASDPDGAPAPLYAAEAGAAMASFLSGLVRCPATGFSFAPAELPDVVAALVACERVRPRGGLSARAFVWGALEARLQSVDTMILGGLNEGTWPQRATSDAFLSRLMRAEIRLDPPERLIGLAAHDIQMMLGMKRVVMTRATRAGGAPTIASRWLQRLLTRAGEDGAGRMRAEGATFIHHARGIDASLERPRYSPPAPRPPAQKRPVRYSVTEVETLIRDPYAVYARRVLRLEAFPELMRAPGAADRGNLFHAILADFATAGHDPAAPTAERLLLDIAAKRFEAERLPAEVEAVWWPRCETLIGNYLAWERERGPRIVRRFAEAEGEIELPAIGVRLRGFADRIDVTAEGGIEIVDFKTGTSPSVRQARTLLAPQLPLEGGMAKRGGFPVLGGGVPEVAELAYVRLRERELQEEALGYTDRKSGTEVTADTLSEEAMARFTGLAAAYRDPEKPYLSRPRPFLAGDFSGPYDHLARAREWSVGDDREGGE